MDQPNALLFFCVFQPPSIIGLPLAIDITEDTTVETTVHTIVTTDPTNDLVTCVITSSVPASTTILFLKPSTNPNGVYFVFFFCN
jgi:hypothetical protein